MHIELTKDQYRRLLALVFLGEWVANGAVPHEDRRRDLQEVADHIYSFARQFDAEDWVEYCQDCGVFHANEAMEEALLPMLDEYDEDVFWDVLSHHLAYRDVMVSVGPDKEFSKEMEMKLWRRKEQYDQEFQRHGLDHVRLVFPGGKKGK
ncbi:hypothetical protein GCM10025857_28370 [Alicyclobacillus contaminans]|uniref:hypothetical protein n=1 Tax=Alicyclobacillus contaminans TaxID=392016 RepID=UPI00041578DA|nr:hypothetical protein [Alicyclobacillus contaminans]GMA51480.1 hypothetical protein GCM10025857_28370 [Alicyclobacillus contaminans]